MIRKALLTVLWIAFATLALTQEGVAQVATGQNGAAQEGTATVLSPREVAAAPLKPGESIRVTGKYKERFDTELYLYGCDVPFIVNDKKLSKRLRDFTPKRDNITVEGEVGSSSGTRVIKVRSVEQGFTDLKILEDKLARCVAKDNSVERILEFVRDLIERDKSYAAADINAVSRKALQQGYQSLKKASAPLAERLAFAGEVERLLQDRRLTLEFLLDIATAFPERAEVRDVLVEFQCRKYRGKWVSYEDFKEQEGLVFYRGAWTTAGEKAHLVALETFLEARPNLLLLRRRTEREYELLASRGKAEPGMTRNEVQSALGFPDRVRRRASQQKEFDQWCYDGEFYYFFNGLLVGVPEKLDE